MSRSARHAYHDTADQVHKGAQNDETNKDFLL
jgi:hypothetical protein